MFLRKYLKTFKEFSKNCKEFVTFLQIHKTLHNFLRFRGSDPRCIFNFFLKDYK